MRLTTPVSLINTLLTLIIVKFSVPCTVILDAALTEVIFVSSLTVGVLAAKTSRLIRALVDADRLVRFEQVVFENCNVRTSRTSDMVGTLIS